MTGLDILAEIVDRIILPLLLIVWFLMVLGLVINNF